MDNFYSTVDKELINTGLKCGYTLEQMLAIVDSKASNKVAKTVVSTKVETPKTKSAKADKKHKAKALKLKVDSFFKTINPNNNKVMFVGKVKGFDNKNNAVIATNKKLYSKEYCHPISEIEFRKLKKVIKSNSADAERKTIKQSLKAKDYKVVYAYYLVKQGKIDQAKFDEIKNDDQALSELYSQFKAEIHLSNAEALKLLAEGNTLSVANA